MLTNSPGAKFRLRYLVRLLLADRAYRPVCGKQGLVEDIGRFLRIVRES